MLVDLEVKSEESKMILRAIDHIYLTRKLTFGYMDDVAKVEKTLEKLDVYITEAGGYFITLVGELDEGYKGVESTDLDGLEPYFATAKKVVYVGGSTFELVDLI